MTLARSVLKNSFFLSYPVRLLNMCIGTMIGIPLAILVVLQKSAKSSCVLIGFGRLALRNVPRTAICQVLFFFDLASNFCYCC